MKGAALISVVKEILAFIAVFATLAAIAVVVVPFSSKPTQFAAHVIGFRLGEERGLGSRLYAIAVRSDGRRFVVSIRPNTVCKVGSTIHLIESQTLLGSRISAALAECSDRGRN